MRNWTPALPIAAALGFSAAVFERLPAEVRPALGTLLPMSPPDSGESFPRIAAALLLPVAAAFVWALLAGLSRIAAPRAPFPHWFANEATDAHAIARFASTYNTIIFSIVSGIALLHVAALGSVIGWPSWTLRAFTAAIGVLMLIVGNVIPRARPNWIVGIRTKGTLASAEVWIRTHRLLGAMLMTVGLLVIVASIVAVRYALVIAGAGGLVALVAAHALGMHRSPSAQPSSEI